MRPFRNIPKSLRDWSRWMSEQTTIESEPASGLQKVTNIYYDKDNSELVVIYDDTTGSAEKRI